MLATAEKMAAWPAANYAHFAAAELHCERNELAAAERHGAKALETARKARHSDNLLIAVLNYARIARASGDWTQAQTLLTEAEDLARPTIPWMKVQVMHEQVSLYLAQGQASEAAQWMAQHQTPPHLRSPIPWLQEEITAARVAAARHSEEGLLPHLASLRERAERLNIRRWVMQVDCLQAAVHHALGQKNEAQMFITSALEAAEAESAFQAILDLGRPALDLISLAQQKKTGSAFIEQLAAACARQCHALRVPPGTTGGPLSHREVELLRLIEQGCSNKEIATRLVIAIGTVKRHTVNIFTKLDVKNRTEAVARAREMGLL